MGVWVCVHADEHGVVVDVSATCVGVNDGTAVVVTGAATSMPVAVAVFAC